MIVVDDVDLPLGIIRTRLSGSSGGHKGLQSVIDKLNTNKFKRIRIGVGSNRKKNISSEKYVLQEFVEEEIKQIDKIVDKAAEIVILFDNKGEFTEDTIKLF